ncbi:histidine kinase [Defluviimonas sp. 20V17]|uniref:PAS domain S-box-containing protein n=1 Tax=Allgaiera indica TaxID=765699 RepID=A0AAN4UU52_9RHOB|nr:PAS domain-containing protein [Allgaiera indica]KDB05440.1 histidine kinase [Defluviimonas sp. 20V17]GHE04719.1 signal transduction histidine kinase [Allgaiera indica]SDX46755.1 PAS domain S-box-containing protein [Allgaiera indica]
MVEADPFQGGLSDHVALQFLASAPFSLVLTDPWKDDNPIVYANRAFHDTTGYPREDVIGRNCRFLQGPGTDPAAVARIHRALEREEEVTVDILNYRSDGTPFWNRLMLAPLRDSDGKVRFFSGVQKMLAPEDAPDHAHTTIDELHHRVKNHLSMVVSLMRMHNREAATNPREVLDKAARRIEGLAMLYEQLTYTDGENNQAVVLGDYLGRVADSVGRLAPRDQIKIKLRADRFTVPVERAVPMGLIVSEVVTNAMQHAFGEAPGTVTINIEEADDGGVRLSIDDDGRGFADGVDWPREGSVGGRLVLQLTASLAGSLSVNSGPQGTRIMLDAPPSVRQRN